MSATPATPLVIGAIAAAASTALTPVARTLARRLDLLDRPNERSSHATPTPRSGGFAIIAGLAIAAGVGGVFRDAALVWLSIGALLLIVLATVDDLWELSRVGRLLAQIIIAAGTSLILLAPLRAGPLHALGWLIAGLTVAILWSVWLTNVYNFMDGINGIAASAASVTGVTMCILFGQRGDIAAAAIALAIAGAAAGFLPWNLTGTIFMGDVGSATLGFLFAGLTLRAAGTGLLIPVVLPMVPFVFDATLTIFMRMVRGEPFFQPHRSHAYQRLVQRGWPHVAVTALWTVLAVACAAVALLWPSLAGSARLVCLTVLAAAHAAIFAVSRRSPSSPLATAR